MQQKYKTGTVPTCFRWSFLSSLSTIQKEFQSNSPLYIFTPKMHHLWSLTTATTRFITIKAHRGIYSYLKPQTALTHAIYTWEHFPGTPLPLLFFYLLCRTSPRSLYNCGSHTIILWVGNPAYPSVPTTNTGPSRGQRIGDCLGNGPLSKGYLYSCVTYLLSWMNQANPRVPIQFVS